MRLRAEGIYKFDTFLPIYNWLYPLSGQPSGLNSARALVSIAEKPIKGRALYIHIPFCETICSFCPFVRGEYKHAEEIDIYVSVLVAEIRRRAEILNRTSNVPVRAIFVGGGTPSLLTPNQILVLGRAIKDSFDISELEEFSFEFEVKSVSDELCDALVNIGATHARFGLQTFDPTYRTLFALTSSLDQVERAAALLPRHFSVTSCDILYGFSGQTEEQFFSDIERVIKLGVSNVDFYPINNTVTQKKLHSAFRRKGFKPMSGMLKFYMNSALRQIMRNHGFLPHNGHGYVRCSLEELNRNPVVTSTYSFVYHEHVYGYDDYDVIGFGVNAISSSQNYSIHNHASRARYLKIGDKPTSDGAVILEHDTSADAVRPLCLRLPYHGKVNRSRLNWNKIPDESKCILSSLIDADLICDNGEEISLSLEGWHWYTNVMFSLLPRSEKEAIESIVKRARTTVGKDIEDSSVPS
jgi:oxygen-independent coproporphyrinogen-3 oxidase